LLVLFVTSSDHKQTHTVSSVTDHTEELSSTVSSRPCCVSEEPAPTPHQQTWQTTADSPARRKKALYAGETKMNCSW